MQPILSIWSKVNLSGEQVEKIIRKQVVPHICIAEYIGAIKTSPPSAREGAMSAMQHETFLKHLESFLETSVKHSENPFENHETPLKL